MLEIEPTAPRRSAGARARVAVAVAAVALATGAGGFAIGRAAAPNSDPAVGALALQR